MRNQNSVIRLTHLLMSAMVLGAMTLFASATPRPFTLSGITLLTPDPQSPFLLDMDGAGTGAHVGNWTNTGTFFLDPKSGRGTGVVDLVAANEITYSSPPLGLPTPPGRSPRPTL